MNLEAKSQRRIRMKKREKERLSNEPLFPTSYETLSFDLRLERSLDLEFPEV